MMGEGVRKLQSITKEQFEKGVYRSKGTFSFVGTPPADKVREHIQSANRDASWYVANKYPGLALNISEYGMVYNQFSYSMPGLLTELCTIYMAVLHAEFFRDLGMAPGFLNPGTGQPDGKLITAAIDHAFGRWPDKYVNLSWNHSKVNYSSIWEFAYSFSEQVATLNLELRR